MTEPGARRARASAKGGGRSTATWAAALVLVLCATIPWLVQRHWDAKPDAATYLLAARSLARGEGYRVMGEPYTLRPPGFSLALAPIVAWRGIDFEALNLAGEAFGVAAVALFFLLLAPRVGNECALAAALALELQPGFQQLCNQVLSDVPGLALALLALLAIRWSGRRPSIARDVVAGAAIALATWVRTANVLLVPALALERLLAPASESRPHAAAHGRERGGMRERLRHATVAGAIALAAYLPWALQPPSGGGYAQDALASYATALVRADALDPDSEVVGPAAIAGRLRVNVASYVGLLGMSPADSRPTPLAWLLAALAIAASLYVGAKRREAPEWLAGITAGVIAVYYVPQARLALVVAVVALANAVEAARDAALRVARVRVADAAVVSALAAATALTFRADFLRPRSAERFAELGAIASYVASTAKPGERLAGDYGSVYALLLDRPVLGLQAVCNQRGDAEARRTIAESGADRVVLQLDGPCAGLRDLGREEARRGAFVVLRLREIAP
ncbi:MAG TPA: glycosyltransferase family 39 protein [Candidatus Binatia bacterium]|nr:glycosyltransferase family 39 protein [Candidatus Binatia bacterium]